MVYLALILLSPVLVAVGMCLCYACAVMYAAATRDPSSPDDDDDDSPGPNIFGHI